MRVSRARRGNVRPVDAQRRRITSDCRLSLENRRSEFFDRAGRLHRHIITVNQRTRKTFNEIRFIRHNGKLTAGNTRCVVCHIDCAVENAARYCVTRRSIHVHGGFAADCSVADIDVAESGTYTESVFTTADDGFFTRNINHSVCADRDTVFFCSGESAAADVQRHFFARVQRRFAFKRAAADIGVDVAHQIHRVCDSGEITRRDGQLGVVIGIQSVNRFRSIDVLRSRLHKRAAVDGHFVAVLHGVVLAVGESAAVDDHDAFGIVFDSVESAVERAAVDDDFKRIGGSNEPLVCRFIVGIVITADKQTAFVAAVAVNNNAAFLIFFTDDQRTVVLDDIPSARPRGFTGKLAAEKRRVAVVEQSRIAVRRDDYFAAAHAVGNDQRAVVDNSVVAFTRQRIAVEVDGKRSALVHHDISADVVAQPYHVVSRIFNRAGSSGQRVGKPSRGVNFRHRQVIFNIIHGVDTGNRFVLTKRLIHDITVFVSALREFRVFGDKGAAEIIIAQRRITADKGAAVNNKFTRRTVGNIHYLRSAAAI